MWWGYSVHSPQIQCYRWTPAGGEAVQPADPRSWSSAGDVQCPHNTQCNHFSLYPSYCAGVWSATISSMFPEAKTEHEVSFEESLQSDGAWHSTHQTPTQHTQRIFNEAQSILFACAVHKSPAHGRCTHRWQLRADPDTLYGPHWHERCTLLLVSDGGGRLDDREGSGQAALYTDHRASYTQFTKL